MRGFQHDWRLGRNFLVMNNCFGQALMYAPAAGFPLSRGEFHVEQAGRFSLDGFEDGVKRGTCVGVLARK